MRRARSIREIAPNPGTVQELLVPNLGLEKVPEEVFACTNLTRLDLSGNKLTQLPDAFDSLPLLRRIDLNGNQIDRLPPSLVRLRGLERLHLQGNDLSQLPEEIPGWQLLRSLRLDQNPLRVLPTAIGNCVRLEDLAASGGHLKGLPDALFQLEKLTYLDLRDNDFIDIPRQLAAMPALNQVLFVGNPVLANDSEPFLGRWLETFFAERFRRGYDANSALAAFDVLLRNYNDLITLPPDAIFSTLDSPFAFIRERAVEVLGKILQDPFAAPEPPKTVVFAGKMDQFNQVEAKEKLESLGYKVKGALPRDAAILVIGSRPGRRLKTALDRGLPVATGNMVEDFLDRQAGRFLKGAGTSNQAMLENLTMLFRSGEKENEALALQMMAQGGVPRELVGAVATRWIFLEEEEEANRLEKILRDSGYKKLVTRIKTQKRLKENLNHSWMQFLTRIAHYPEMDLGELLDVGMQYQVVPRKDAFQVKGIDLKPLIEQSIDKGELTLFNYHLGSFPKEITEFEGLRRIFMMGNQIKHIPPDIGRLQSLKRLFLSTNHIEGLPAEMANLNLLEDLNLGSNRLKKLPPVICQMKSLIRLELWNNPLGDLPDELGELKELKELDLGECPLHSIPNVVWNLPSLEVLNLYSCRLGHLPEEAPDWPRLHFLNLGINALRHLPEWLGELSHLQTLILNRNPVKVLPESLRRAHHLRELWVPNNLDWSQALPIIKDLPLLNRLVLSGDHPDHRFNLWLQDQLPHVIVLSS